MTNVAKSPDRGTFQAEGYLKRQIEKGEEPNEEYLNMFKTWKEQTEELESSEEWKTDNLEYDLRSTGWIIAKARERDAYAQNIYAALCNMQWQRREVLPILKDQYWSCTWRHAGGIVADMLGKGDYIDWYCSGIRDAPLSDMEFNELSLEDQLAYKERQNYASEGVVTDEIEEDFYKLNWIPVPFKDNEL